MRRVIALLVALGFLAGAFQVEAIEIYKFKKERVDQSLKGNRGYISGQPPAVEEKRNLKRTLIGIDIEIPSGILPGGKDLPEEKAQTGETPAASKSGEEVIRTEEAEVYIK